MGFLDLSVVAPSTILHNSESGKGGERCFKSVGQTQEVPNEESASGGAPVWGQTKHAQDGTEDQRKKFSLRDIIFSKSSAGSLPGSWK